MAAGAGIGLETARRARGEGADVILTGRNQDRLQATAELVPSGPLGSDATDFSRLDTFFNELPTPVDHVLVTGPGPYYAPLAISTARGHTEAGMTTCG